MAEKRKDLPRVHRHRGRFYRDLAIFIDFTEATHAQTIAFTFDLC